MRSVIVAGTNSGCGKTTVTIGLMALLQDAGYKVAPFKTGPDYIDPAFHAKVTGRYSYNLDSFLLSKEMVQNLYVTHSVDSDISVIEGVMGLFDGMGETGVGSAALLSKQLNAPVILVVNCKSLYQSVAAIIGGFVNFDVFVNVAGVILNHVQTIESYNFLKSYIEKHVGVKCIGYLPTDKTISLESRHLGLVQANEVDNFHAKIEKLKSILSQTIDLDALIDIAQKAKDLSVNSNILEPWKRNLDGLKLGVAMDNAFQFYYRDNLELLEKNGAELTFFSPLNDTHLPTNINALYIGGGYPELFATELSNNSSMLLDIKDFAQNNKSIFAECGGLMYLCSEIVDKQNKAHPMVDVFNYASAMTDRLQRFGYCNVMFNQTVTRAHEFHHSVIQPSSDNSNYTLSFNLNKPEKNREWQCGLKYKNVLAGYAHFHFLSEPAFYHKIIDLWMQKTI